MLCGGIEVNVVAGLVSSDEGRLLSSCVPLKIDIHFLYVYIIYIFKTSEFFFKHFIQFFVIIKCVLLVCMKVIKEAYLKLYLVSYFKDHWTESRFVHFYLHSKMLVGDTSNLFRKRVGKMFQKNEKWKSWCTIFFLGFGGFFWILLEKCLSPKIVWWISFLTPSWFTANWFAWLPPSHKRWFIT